jgi:hypothetical protein
VTPIETQLLDAIKTEKPLILFLGQNYANITNPDPTLESILTRKKSSAPTSSGWPAVLDIENLTNSDYEWLAERCERNVIPESLTINFELPWSGVFTTSVDQTIVRHLETRGRVPETILAKDHYSRVPRSRFRPPVHYLFGKLNETESDFRPPTNQLELLQRISIHTNALLNRISDTVTPVGLLVIDGYNPEADWLSIDTLLAPLSLSKELKILFLGITDTPKSAFYSALEKRGNIQADRRSLSEITQTLLKNDEPLFGSIDGGEAGTVTLENKKIFVIPPALRLRVEASAAVVDDTWTQSQPLLLGRPLEEDFRSFHGGFGGVQSLVEGVGKSYAIHRDFEKDLLSKVIYYLKNPGLLDSYLIIHGQSGTGKTLSLARIALLLREKHKLPVIYAKARIPHASDVEDFAAEAEKAGASSTIIICDANQSHDKYKELANSLKSRGRRSIVIGTSYITEGVKKGNLHFTEAPAKLSQDELDALKSLIKKFLPLQYKDINVEEENKYILAFLYRHLSMSRARIIDGITNEARNTEQTVRIRAQSMPRSDNPQYALASQLIALGLGTVTSKLFEDEIKDEPELDSAGKLIDFVMVAGRVDCPVPLNLLLRALNSSDKNLNYVQIAYLFEELDLFRWHVADAEGNELLVQPRLRLEAELICRRRLAERDKEIDYIVCLIESVRTSHVDGRSEISFLLNLLNKLQKDGPRGNAYRLGFLRIANALTTLRVKHDVKDASVMLQESSFRRSAIFISDQENTDSTNKISEENRASILNEARDIVELALKEIHEKRLRASRKTQQNFAVERASIYGYLAVGLAKTSADESEIWSYYLAARAAISKAMSVVNNHYPLDIAIWAPIDILKCANSSPIHELELKADVYAVFDQLNAELANKHSAKILERKFKVARTLGSIELAQEAYDELEKTNPALAFYLKARAMCGDLFDLQGEKISESLRNQAGVAANFLWHRLEAIREDVRALQLLIQLLWIEKSGEMMLRRERCPIPADKIFQQKILSLVKALNNVSGEAAKNNYRFLEATFEWLVGSGTYARELFNTLSKDTEFEDSSRIVRRLILEGTHSTYGGFKGRIEKNRGEGHWTISVEGLVNTVDLLARDFAKEDLREGREIRDFNIAFNHLGPIADPLSRQGARP